MSILSLTAAASKINEHNITNPAILPVNKNVRNVKADDKNMYTQINTIERDKMIAVIVFLNCLAKQSE
jgi:hypothetical protein